MSENVKELFNLTIVAKEVKPSKQSEKQFIVTSTGLWVSVSSKIDVTIGESYSLSGYMTSYENKPQFAAYFVAKTPVKEIPF